MKKNKIKHKKGPSLFRKIVEVYYERALQRRALRILSGQKWSIEFLEYLIRHAATSSSSGIEIEITDIEGRKLKISSTKINEKIENDLDILSRLDDPIAVQRFIMTHNRR